MDVKQNLIWKNSMLYGAYTALAMILFTLLFYFTNNMSSNWQGLAYGFLIAGLTIGTIYYRDKVLGGFINYSNALRSGILISVFTGVIMGFFMFILYTRDPKLLENQLIELQERMLDKGIDPDTIEKWTSGTKDSLTPFSSVLSSIMVYFAFGLVISLIMAAFVKKEPSPFDIPNNNSESNQQHISE